MSNLKIKFDIKKIQREIEKGLNQAIEEENEAIMIRKIISERNGEMKLLNDTEKELLKIILNSEHDDYTYHGNVEQFPEYIKFQIKKLFAIMEECGYAARTFSWLSGGWQVILTPLGVNYFEKEEE